MEMSLSASLSMGPHEYGAIIRVHLGYLQKFLSPPPFFRLTNMYSLDFRQHFSGIMF